MQRSRVLAAFVLVTGLAWGCGDDGDAAEASTGDGSGTTGALDDTTGAAVDAGEETQGVDETGSANTVIPQQGLWRLNVGVVEVGGLEIPMQAELTNSGNAEDGSLAVSWQLRAYDDENDTTSDVIGTADAVALTSDGSFVAAFGDVVLPDAYSPTGTAVTLADLQLDGQFTAPDAVCGTVTALVVEVRLPLTASTFGGAPWDSGIVPAIDCDGEPMMPLARIDPRECPALLDGFNAGFPSAELDRELYLYLPTDVDTGGPWPVVFAYHGLGGSADWITIGGDNDLITPIDDRGYILVSPESQALPGTEWEQANTNDNADLVFFDDILTCIDAQYGVDADEIYVTGMSAGGLYTSYLGLVRADVIAALAPMSGGLLVDYAAPASKRPYLVSWGGVDDNAVGQDFDQFAQDLMADLGANGHFYAACDHGQGHTWPAEMTDPVLEFLFAHPNGTDPSPYADGLPPADFPNFCTVP